MLCGGAFNTPQLLMLSGIGDRRHLEAIARRRRRRVRALRRGRHAAPGRRVAASDRPAGRRQEPAGPLRGQPGQPDAEGLLAARRRHLRPPAGADESTVTSRSGAPKARVSTPATARVLGIFKRSNPDLDQPDLFIFGLPFAFRGYELGYSEIEATTRRSRGRSSRATRATATARSGCAARIPATRRSSTSTTSTRPHSRARATHDPDAVALVDGVRFVRGIIERADDRCRRAGRGKSIRTIAAVPDDDAQHQRLDPARSLGASRLRHLPDGAGPTTPRRCSTAASASAASPASASWTPRSSRASPGTSSSPTSTWRARRPPTCCTRIAKNGQPDDPWYPRDLRRLEAAARAAAPPARATPVGRPDRGRAGRRSREGAGRRPRVAARRHRSGAVGRRRAQRHRGAGAAAGAGEARTAPLRRLPLDRLGRRLHRRLPRPLVRPRYCSDLVWGGRDEPSAVGAGPRSSAS